MVFTPPDTAAGSCFLQSLYGTAFNTAHALASAARACPRLRRFALLSNAADPATSECWIPPSHRHTPLALGRMPCLTSLALMVPLDDADLVAIAENCPQLASLALGGATITDAGLTRAAGSLRGLERLELDLSPAKRRGAGPGQGPLPVGGYAVTDAGLCAVAAACPLLTGLSLREHEACEGAGDGAPADVGATARGSLTLGRAAGAALAAHCPAFSALRLDSLRCAVPLALFEALGGARALRRLQLRYCEVTDGGHAAVVDAVAGGGFSALETLTVRLPLYNEGSYCVRRCCKREDAAMRRLARVRPDVRLEYSYQSDDPHYEADGIAHVCARVWGPWLRGTGALQAAACAALHTLRSACRPRYEGPGGRLSCLGPLHGLPEHGSQGVSAASKGSSTGATQSMHDWHWSWTPWGAHRALCPRCAKSPLFSTPGSHGSQGLEFRTPDAVLNGSCTPL